MKKSEFLAFRTEPQIRALIERTSKDMKVPMTQIIEMSVVAFCAKNNLINQGSGQQEPRR